MARCGALYSATILGVLLALPAVASAQSLDEIEQAHEQEREEPDEDSNAFKGSRLFVNHSMKYDVGRTFGIGINFTIAPVKAAQRTLVNNFRQQYPAESEILLEAANHVSPDDIRGLNAAQLRERLKAVPTLSADEVTQVDSAFDTLGITDSDTALVAQMLEVMTDQETAITFSLEPYASFHFDILDLFLTIPLAGFAAEETDFALGNIGLEARFGHSFGDTFAGGISYGLQFWSPTATEKANGLGLANLLWSPRYFHEYMTVAPYFVAGADLMFVTIQASVAYNMMFAVKGDPDFDQVHFLQYGASLAITAIPYIIISAELAGMVDIIDAPAYNNSLSLTAGLRFASSFVDIGVAFQVPLVQGDSSDYASFSGVSFGSPSSFNTIISATFGL